VKHEAPIAKTKIITVSVPPAPTTPPTTGSPQLIQLRSTCVDAFRRSDSQRVVSRIVELIGLPSKSEGRWGQYKLETSRWERLDGLQIFEEATKRIPEQLRRPAPDALRTGVESISIVIWDTEGLPFFVLTLIATFVPGYWARFKPEELGANLSTVTHPLRWFVEGLGGLVAEMGGVSPRIPCVTWAGVATSQEQLDHLVVAAETEPHTPILWEDRDPAFFGDIPLNPPTGFPFRLERDYRTIQRRSMVQVAGNLVVLFGLSDQFGLVGSDCPYALLVTSNADLLRRRPESILHGLALPSTYAEFLWSGASSIVTITALKVWLRGLAIEVGGLEVSAFGWRHAMNRSISPSKSNDLDVIMDVALRSASIASDLGLVERVFGESLEIWKRGEFERTREIPGDSQGVLGALSTETLELIRDRRARLKGIG
jgi:hypothetical protein